MASYVLPVRSGSGILQHMCISRNIDVSVGYRLTINRMVASAGAFARHEV